MTCPWREVANFRTVGTKNACHEWRHVKRETTSGSSRRCRLPAHTWPSISIHETKRFRKAFCKDIRTFCGIYNSLLICLDRYDGKLTSLSLFRLLTSFHVGSLRSEIFLKAWMWLAGWMPPPNCPFVRLHKEQSSSWDLGDPIREWIMTLKYSTSYTQPLVLEASVIIIYHIVRKPVPKTVRTLLCIKSKTCLQPIQGKN